MKQLTLFGLGNTTSFVEELQEKYAINYETAKRAHYWTSHVPDQRGKQEVEGFKQAIAEYFEKLRQKSAIPQAEWEADFEKFVAEMHKRESALLAKRSGLASTFVTGGSNFPHRQQEKRNDSYNKAFSDNLSWKKWAFEKLLKKVANKKDPVRIGQQGASALLKEELERLNRLQDIIKRFNKLFAPRLEQGEQLKFGDLEAAFSPEDYTTIKLIFKGKTTPFIPFSGYRMDEHFIRKSILNTENKIFKQNKLDKEAAEGVKEYEFNGGSIVGNAAIDRWQVFFDSKPNAGMIAKLKQNGFKWSPSNKAWQRFYHTTSLQQLKWVLGDIYPKAKVEEESKAEETINFDDFTPEESDKDYGLAIAKYEGYELMDKIQSAFEKYVNAFDFQTLFIELGWSYPKLKTGDRTSVPIADLAGLVVIEISDPEWYHDAKRRSRLMRGWRSHYGEVIGIFFDENRENCIWRRKNKEYHLTKGGNNASFIERLPMLEVSMEAWERGFYIPEAVSKVDAFFKVK